MINLLAVHHYLAFLTLILLVIVSVYTLYVRALGSGSLRIGKGLSIAMIASLHTQVFFGLMLIGHMISILQGNGVSLGSVMKDPLLRYRIFEHPFMMLLAVILATLAHVRLKKEGFSSKVATLFVLSLVVLLNRLPFDLLFA
ncbi:MAG: hypothetical protein ACMUEL_04340 [Flavobacteriales bacterium Tduv]